MKLYKYVGRSKYATIEQIFYTSAMALDKAKSMIDCGFVEYEIITLEE